MTETELISEILVFNLTLTQLIALENVIAFIRHDILKSYIITSIVLDYQSSVIFLRFSKIFWKSTVVYSPKQIHD
jgi:hypothetical protein